MRGLVAGLGVMLVDEGGADGEAGGGSPSSSAKLQLIGALRRGKCSGGAARAHRFGWAAAWRLTGASPATRSLARLPPWALLACAVLLLAGAPPEPCWWLTWRGCWCCDQGRRNLRPHLHPRRSRCAPLRSLRRPRRPAGPACPRETVFGLCGCTGAGLALTGAAEPPASLCMALL